MCSWGEIDQYESGQEQMVTCNIRSRINKDFVTITITLSQHQLGHHRLDHCRDLWQRSQAGSGRLKALIWIPALKSIMKRLQMFSRIFFLHENRPSPAVHALIELLRIDNTTMGKGIKNTSRPKKWEERGFTSYQSLQIKILWTKMLGLKLVVFLPCQPILSLCGRQGLWNREKQKGEKGCP